MFPSGAITAVVGPSGSGKSSLLRVLAGMDVPTSGSVVVAGRPIERASPRDRRLLRRHDLGYVFPRPSDNFVPHLTVAQHVSRIAPPTGTWTRPSRRSASGIGPITCPRSYRGRAAARRVRAGDRERRRHRRGGRAHRRAGQRLGARHILEAIRALRARGVAFILATHDPAVTAIADVVVRLDHGEVVDGKRPPAGPTTIVDPPRDPPPIGEVRLQVRNLVKTFGRGGDVVHAVDDVSFEAARGEMVGLIGRSGSGKTTLLSLIAGWERADRGTVARPPGSAEGHPPWRDVAVVPQNLGLMDELTIRENVASPARLEGSLDDHVARVDGLLEALGLTTLEHRRPSETSAGEQQRAAVARALLFRPRSCSWTSPRVIRTADGPRPC